MAPTMTDKQWYAKFDYLNRRLDAAQRTANDEFVRWSANPQGEIPPSARVDELQEELREHMEIAPNDEPEDELEAKVREERFAQEQFDSMGRITGHSQPLRETQTAEHHDRLAQNTHFLVDDNSALPVWKVDSHKTSARKVPSEATARDRMGAALKAFGEANPDLNYSVSEADRDRLLGAVGAVQDDDANFETTE